MTPFEYSIRREGACYVVSLSGDFLLDSTPATRKVLFDCLGEGAPLLVDMREVHHIDGSGVASLVEVYHCALRSGIGFSLVAPSPGVVLVLELSRLHRVFPLCDTLEDGLCQLAGPSVSSLARVTAHESKKPIHIPA